MISPGEQPSAQEQTEAFARDMATLLSASDFPAEEKVAWAELIVLMEPQDLMHFHELLRGHVLAQAEEEVRPLLDDLAQMKEKYEQKKKEATAKAMAGIKEVENELN